MAISMSHLFPEKEEEPAMSMTRTEIANAALDTLAKNCYYEVDTARLLRTSGCAEEGVEHLTFREVMNNLHARGVVTRRGVGKFIWKIAVQTWDRNNPFKQVNKETEPEPNYSDTKKPIEPHIHEVKKIDQTYNDRLQEKIGVLVEANDTLSKTVLEAQEKVKELTTTLDLMKERLKASEEEKAQRVRIIKIERWDGKVIKLKDKVFPKQFERVLDLAKCRRNILLTGPAGCGKSYLAKAIAEALAFDFGSISCTAGMSEAHLLGRAVPDLTHGKNRFQGTSFLKCFEEGGVFLMDELDAADPNLLLAINTALANGYCNLPNRADSPVAFKSDDFVMIATANTVGRGATRMYSGRNQLDESTVDRFRIGVVEMDYDLQVEKALCPDIGGDDGKNFLTTLNGHQKDDTVKKITGLGYNLRETCWYIRSKIDQSGMRRIMSSRFLEDAYVMMHKAEWTIEKCLEAYFTGWTSEEKAKVI
jgi:cobaltochelatase CobS